MTHHRAKLPSEVVRKVREMHATGTVGYRLISRALKRAGYECGESTVRDIVQYRTRAAA